jgi:hypothetical protein
VPPALSAAEPDESNANRALPSAEETRVLGDRAWAPTVATVESGCPVTPPCTADLELLDDEEESSYLGRRLPGWRQVGLAAALLFLLLGLNLLVFGNPLHPDPPPATPPEIAAPQPMAPLEELVPAPSTEAPEVGPAAEVELLAPLPAQEPSPGAAAPLSQAASPAAAAPRERSAPPAAPAAEPARDKTSVQEGARGWVIRR